MISKTLLTAQGPVLALTLALTLLVPFGCEGMSYEAQTGRGSEPPPRETTPVENPRQPTRPRTTGRPGWERGARSGEVPIEGANDEAHSVRFEPREPRIQAGGTREVTVALIGPELFEPISFLAYSPHGSIAEVPVGAVTFEAGERRATLVIEARALAGTAAETIVISFETIDFARPERFEHALIVTRPD